MAHKDIFVTRDLPTTAGSKILAGYASPFDATVVAVETDAGVTGYAECCPLGSAYLPAYAAGVRAGLAEMTRWLPSTLRSDGPPRSFHFSAPSSALTQ